MSTSGSDRNASVQLWYSMLWAVRPLVRIPQVSATLSWNAPPGRISPVYRSAHITRGARHFRYSLRWGALCHCTQPRYDPPAMPILPSLHDWRPIHSCVSKPSSP